MAADQNNQTQAFSLDAETRGQIRNVLFNEFEPETEYPLPSIAHCLNRNGFSKNDLGIAKLSQLYQELPFLEVIPGSTVGTETAVLHADTPDQESADRPESRNGMYIYAKYVHLTKANAVQFSSVDQFSFYLNETMMSSLLPDLKKDEYAWFQIKDEDLKRVYVSQPNLTAEARMFEKFYREGDLIRRPVIEKDDLRIKIALGPALFSVIYKSSGQSKFFEIAQPGEIYTFRIRKISMEDNRLRTSLEYTTDEVQTLADNDEMIPDDFIDQCTIPSSMMERIINDRFQRQAFESVMDGEITERKLRAYIKKQYFRETEDNTLVVKYQPDQVAIDIDLNLKNEYGVPLKACVNRRHGRDSFVLGMIGATDPASEFERFVKVYSWPKILNELASLALDEQWDYSSGGRDDKYILRQYLRFNFYKAKLDGILVEENGDALFNTGLVDSSYDDIYCYLRRDSSEKNAKKWVFGYFACRGKGTDGKLLNSSFSVFPSAPVYVRQDQLENIYFDTTKDLACDYEHIIEDNLSRLPMDFISHTLAYDSELQSRIRAGANIRSIRNYVIEHPELIRSLENALKSAVGTAVKYCRWNYKTAIPIYYPRTNNISLLLPLNLTGQKNSVDVALVIEKLRNGNYQGQTILTLDMAYLDARQICRPNSEWLSLEKITEDQTEESA